MKTENTPNESQKKLTEAHVKLGEALMSFHKAYFKHTGSPIEDAWRLRDLFVIESPILEIKETIIPGSSESAAGKTRTQFSKMGSALVPEEVPNQLTPDMLERKETRGPLQITPKEIFIERTSRQALLDKF